MSVVPADQKFDVSENSSCLGAEEMEFQESKVG